MDTTTTLAAFIAEHELTAEVAYADSNPNMLDGEDMTHYLVTISRPAGGTWGPDRMHVPFSMGAAHTREPELAEVLDCLASDASSIENASSFDDWATEMGFFPMESSDDYNRAKDTYGAIQDQSDALARLLGDGYERLLWNTDRL